MKVEVGEIYKTTEEAQVRLRGNDVVHYPFDELYRQGKGCSFFVEAASVNESSFRALVSSASSKVDSNFRCIKHRNDMYDGFIEVANVGADKNKKENKSKFVIYESSPEAKGIVIYNTHQVYPFDELREGLCFTVECSNNPETNKKLETSLRGRCSIKGKQLGKKFVIIKHETCFEVACVPKAFRFKAPILQTSPKTNALVQEWIDEA